MKNKKYIIIILLLILVLVGCKNTKGNEDENLLPEDTIAFLEAVEKIEFSLNCKEQLEVCFELYDNLGENSWDYDEVLDAFNMLVKFENLIKDYVGANLRNDVKNVRHRGEAGGHIFCARGEVVYSQSQKGEEHQGRARKPHVPDASKRRKADCVKAVSGYDQGEIGGVNYG